jgi:hypothetical protein
MKKTSLIYQASKAGCCFFFLLMSCVEPYDPPAVSKDVNILVVDGFVNTTDGSATVRLSHTNLISSDSTGAPESNATVVIEDEAGTTFTLTEKNPGQYSTEGIAIKTNLKYRLLIERSDDHRIASDFIELQTSPPIDSLTWGLEDNGLNILVNTHGNSETGYYYWDYVETWEYNSALTSYYKLVDKVPTLRPSHEGIQKCWRTVSSSKIIVGSSSHLQENVIQGFPITFIPAGSSKISILYSIIVRQRSLSRQEYEFWKELEKTTESLGSLFDPMPYQVIGNLRSETDPDIEVLGVFSAGSIQEKRLFIHRTDLPSRLTAAPAAFCPIDTVCIYKNPAGDPRCKTGLADLNGEEPLLDALYSGNTVWGYTRASPECSDCRLHGGTVTRPDFWQ